MILDTIDHFEAYAKQHKGLAAAADFLKRAREEAPAEGRHEIAGECAYGLLRRYTPQTPQNALLEAHRQYIDVQFVMRGREVIRYAEVSQLKPAADYDAGTDCQLFEGEGMDVHMKAGMFAVFYPWDAHQPKLPDGEPAEVVKAVVKVRV